MELIVISDPVCFEGETSLINELFAAGMSVFHLRKPELGKLAYARLIAQIDEIYHDRIALHQFHDLADFFPSIARIHYPEWLRNSTTVTTMQTETPVIRSTSIHNLKDLDRLNGFDYTFYGPVFNSLSKPAYAGITKTDFVLPERKNGCKIIALGGIDAEKIKQVKPMGFDGLAVLGAIWNKKESVTENFNILKNSNK
jgi:thiamine-phosphate pyrophosphorylase